MLGYIIMFVILLIALVFFINMPKSSEEKKLKRVNAARDRMGLYGSVYDKPIKTSADKK